MTHKFGELPHRNTGPEFAMVHPFTVDDGIIGAKCFADDGVRVATHRVSAGTNIVDAEWRLSKAYTDVGRALR